MKILGYISNTSENTELTCDQSNLESNDLLTESESNFPSRRHSKSPPPEEIPNQDLLNFIQRNRNSLLSLRLNSRDFKVTEESEADGFIAPPERNIKEMKCNLPEVDKEIIQKFKEDSETMNKAKNSQIESLEETIQNLKTANSSLRNEKILIIQQYEDIIKKLINLKLHENNHSKRDPTNDSIILVRPLKENISKIESIKYENDEAANSPFLRHNSDNCVKGDEIQSKPDDNYCPQVDKQVKSTSLINFQDNLSPGISVSVTCSSNQIGVTKIERNSLQKETSPSEDKTNYTLPITSSPPRRFSMLNLESQNQTVVSTTVKRIKVDGTIVYEKKSE
jgi:hypothetical protein